VVPAACRRAAVCASRRRGRAGRGDGRCARTGSGGIGGHRIPAGSRRVPTGKGEHFAGLQSFSVLFRAGYDVVQASGQKIEFGETRRLVLARPDRLRMDEVSSDGRSERVLFDGRLMTVLDAEAGVDAQAPQPGTIDDTLGYFVRNLRMGMPLALLITTRLPGVLAGAVKTIDFVESTAILGMPTQHIAGRSDNVDFQVWIMEGKSPLPPPGSMQTPFAVQVRRSAESERRPVANGEVES